MRLILFTLISMLTLTASQAKFDDLIISSDNSVVISEAITPSSVQNAINKLIELDNKRKDSSPIYIVMDSPGGSIMHGNKLIRFANTLENVKTVCIFCASMAHAIAQGVKGERLATPYNIMMAHRARGGFRGQFEDGELESRLALYKKIVRSMEQQNADRIGISLKSYKKKVINEWWTYGKESKQLNIVDKIINLKCSKELINKKVDNMVNTMFGAVKQGKKSACPLI